MPFHPSVFRPELERAIIWLIRVFWSTDYFSDRPPEIHTCTQNILFVCRSSHGPETKSFLLERSIFLGPTSSLIILENLAIGSTGGNISQWVIIHWLQWKQKLDREESDAEQTWGDMVCWYVIISYCLGWRSDEDCSWSALGCAVHVWLWPCTMPPAQIPWLVSFGEVKGAGEDWCQKVSQILIWKQCQCKRIFPAFECCLKVICNICATNNNYTA